MYESSQLDLFSTKANLNVVYELKREIRLALSNTGLSRDQVIDRMNELASRDGLKLNLGRATLDGWTKDSDPGRLPTLPGLVLFCRVLGTTAPISAMLRPLGCGVIGPEEVRILEWGKAEQAKRQAIRKARLALEAIA